jgi:hypothetical protein
MCIVDLQVLSYVGNIYFFKVVMLLQVISKDFKPGINSISPFVQTVSEHAPNNFIMRT